MGKEQSGGFEHIHPSTPVTPWHSSPGLSAERVGGVPPYWMLTKGDTDGSPPTTQGNIARYEMPVMRATLATVSIRVLDRMFFFFSNRLGCLGSLLLSVVATAILLVIFTR